MKILHMTSCEKSGRYVREGRGSRTAFILWEGSITTANLTENITDTSAGSGGRFTLEMDPISYILPVFHIFLDLFEVVTWNVETLAVSTNSLHPVAAVGKRLLTGQVKNQAQQRKLTPLWEGSCFTCKARGGERRVQRESYLLL